MPLISTKLEALKHAPVQAQKRTGWVKRGVAGPESIADHMYRMGLMAMLVQGTQYDYHRQDGVGRARVTNSSLEYLVGC